MNTPQRLVLVDALRGIAIALMVIYHFCYDLTYFKLAYFDFYQDEFWLQFRNFIVSSFLFIVGVSFTLATQKDLNWKSFNKRLMLIFSAALIISVVTYFIFPGRTIFFGILHFIAFATVAALCFYKLYWSNLIIGLAFIITGLNIKLAMFDNTWFSWIGFVTHKPATEDFVPVFPWFGVVLMGMFAGKFFLTKQNFIRFAISFPKAGQFNWLTLAGRNSLLIYLIHQPILMGILYLATLAI